jgi:hypothetical protein
MSGQREGGCSCGALRHRLASDPPAQRVDVGWVSLPEGTPAFDVHHDTARPWPAESLRRLEAVRSRAR